MRPGVEPYTLWHEIHFARYAKRKKHKNSFDTVDGVPLLLISRPVSNLSDQVLLLLQFWHRQELFTNPSAFYTTLLFLLQYSTAIQK